MLPVFLAAALWLPALLGLGKLLRLEPDPQTKVPVLGFSGLAVLAAAANTVHLVAPISPAISCALWLLGVGLFFRDPVKPPALAPIALLVISAFAQAPGRYYDAGLYYLQVLRWMTEAPVALGLASLHERLGFNSAWLSAAAGMQVPFWSASGNLFINVLAAFLGAAAVWPAALAFVAGDRSIGNVLLLLAVGPVVITVGSVGGALQDPPAALLVYLSTALWFRGQARSAFVLAVFAATVKLSAAIAPLVGLALLLCRWRAQAIPSMIAAASIAVPWAAHGFLLSGCFAFPVAATCVAVPWGLPRDRIVAFAEVIRDWARLASAPASGTSAMAWVVPWARRFMVELTAFAVVLPAGLVIGAVRGERPVQKAVLVAWSAAAVGVGFWLWASPDVRFGLPYLFPFVLLPIAYGLSQRRITESPRVRRALVAGTCAIAASVMAGYAARLPEFQVMSCPQVPQVATVEIVKERVTVRVPIVGDQCWDAPRPCVPR